MTNTHNLFEAVVNNKVPLTTGFAINSICANYDKYSGFKGYDRNFSIWYQSPLVTSLSSLNSSELKNFGQSVALHYPLRAFYSDGFSSNSTNVNSLYYIFNNVQGLIKYPAQNSSSIYKYWTRTTLDWNYFQNGKMNYYDGRWRDFYRKAKNFTYPITFGPYLNPSSDNIFVLTLSNAVYLNSGELHGVLNVDINLQLTTDDEISIDISEDVYYYFITEPNGNPLMHSKVKINQDGLLLTQLEYSKNSTPLGEPPDTKETR